MIIKLPKPYGAWAAIKVHKQRLYAFLLPICSTKYLTEVMKNDKEKKHKVSSYS
jgi:hypothetical protein